MNPYVWHTLPGAWVSKCIRTDVGFPKTALLAERRNNNANIKSQLVIGQLFDSKLSKKKKHNCAAKVFKAARVSHSTTLFTSEICIQNE